MAPLPDSHVEYARSALTEAQVHEDPIQQFRQWYGDAEGARPAAAPYVMVLATAAPDGTPSARVVLLRGLDERGFAFYTDYRSRKGAELAANPRGALVFYWAELERQVRVSGGVEHVTAAESDAYFRSRPLGSRLGALASHQSQVLATRSVLDQRVAELARTHPDGTDVARPAYWGGYRVVPLEIEFWQGRPSRLHDRLRYRRDRIAADSPWIIERLSP